MRFANFAHAELLTWGGYLALVVVAFIGAGLPTAAACASAGTLVVAAALRGGADRRARLGRGPRWSSSACGAAARTT